MKHHGCCPKCGRPFGEVQASEHHVMPTRFFRNPFIIIVLCTECHAQLEKRIPQGRQMSLAFYFMVVNNFLGFKAVTPPERIV